MSADKRYSGRAFTFGDDIDTDVIIPARYLNTIDPVELGSHCMEDVDPDFSGKAKPGDVIIAGKNFGCGSSRDHAPIAIKALGLKIVIARSFARIFYRNAFNNGLILIESDEAIDKITRGDEVEIDLKTGVIKNISQGSQFAFPPIPDFMLELVGDGGLIPHILKKQGKG